MVCYCYDICLILACFHNLRLLIPLESLESDQSLVLSFSNIGIYRRNLNQVSNDQQSLKQFSDH